MDKNSSDCINVNIILQNPKLSLLRWSLSMNLKKKRKETTDFDYSF